MPTINYMQNRIIAVVITALIMSSCYVINDSTRTEVQLFLANNNHTITDDSAAFKVHRPGEASDAPETLEWAPNNLTELATMQFTIILDSNLPLQTIEQIDIIGAWISNSGQLFEQFQVEFTEFTVNQGPDIATITVNYTYSSTVWAGDYLITVDILFPGDESISIERRDLSFVAMGYYFGYSNTSEEMYLCSCEKGILRITLKNTGEDETEFSYLIDINQTQEVGKVDWDGESEAVSRGVLAAGESVELEIKLLIRDDISRKNVSLAIPIYTEISYEDDEGEQIYLVNQASMLMSTILSEAVFPVVELSFNGFDYSLLFEDGIAPLTPPILIDEAFSHTNDYLMVQLNITNQGYYDRFIEIEATNAEFEYRVIYGDTNISINQLLSDTIPVPRLESIAVTLMVEDIGLYQYESLEFNIGFNRSLTAAVSFDMRPEPQITGDVFINAIVYDDSLTLPATFTQMIAIDLSEYENFVLFDNRWSLDCSHSNDMIVTVVYVNQECMSAPIIFDFATDAEQLLNLEVAIDIGANFAGEIATLELILVPVVTGSISNINHSLTIEIPIAIIEDEPNDDDTDDADDNATEDDTDNPDDTGEEGNETEVNQDSDGDGVFDLTDSCPNTQSGVVVDEVGCEIIEQDVDDSTEQIDNQLDNEGENQPETEASTKQETDDSILTYLIIGIVIAAIGAGLLFIRGRGAGKQAIPTTKTIQPITPLPPIPLAPVEPVVLQQWTDANGYSWRQMSDQSIMWWNGTDWIPYGKN